MLPSNTISQQLQHLRQSHDQFKCFESGIYGDDYDCTKYYKCIKIRNNLRSEFRQLAYKCNFGKVFSSAHGICTQPQQSGRIECINYQWLEEHNNSGN